MKFILICTFTFLYCGFALGTPLNPSLPKHNFTSEVAALKVRSKALHDGGTAYANSLIAGGYRHLVDGIITQLGLLWNYNYDLEHSDGQMTIVKFNILSAGMTHRENRMSEEKAVVNEVQRMSAAGQLNWTSSDLDVKLSYQTIFEGILKSPDNMYKYVREIEDKHLTDLEKKFKEAGKTLEGDSLKKAVEEFVRIYLSLDLIEKSRMAVSVEKLAYNN